MSGAYLWRRDWFPRLDSPVILGHTLIGYRTKARFRLWAASRARTSFSSGRPDVNSTGRHLIALTAISLLVLCAGCSDRDPAGLEVARAPIDPLVFDDDYSDDVYFQPFSEHALHGGELDSVYAYGGTAFDGARSLKFTIPPAGLRPGRLHRGRADLGGRPRPRRFQRPDVLRPLQRADLPERGGFRQRQHRDLALLGRPRGTFP